MSLDLIRDRISSTGVVYDIKQAAGTGDFLPLARLTLHTPAPNFSDVAFDPTVHSHPGVQLLFERLTSFRRAARRRSREGRNAE